MLSCSCRRRERSPPTASGPPGSAPRSPGFVVHASTLAGIERDDLKRTLVASRTASVIRLDGRPYATRSEPLGSEVFAVLQRPLTEVLRPYDRLVAGLLVVVGTGLAVVLTGALWFRPK